MIEMIQEDIGGLFSLSKVGFNKTKLYIIYENRSL